ncbi:MAG: putative bifunctional diguanylate cyclase/phosphodiesterase [Gammaproteobacteria bacterium]
MNDHTATPHTRIDGLMLFSQMLTVIASFAAALLFEGTNPHELQQILLQGGVPLFALLWVLWGGIRLRRFLAPVYAGLRQTTIPQSAHGALRRRLTRFSWVYWSTVLSYALLLPAIYIAVRGVFNSHAYVTFALVQLAVAVLIGVPTYLLALERLGRLSPQIGFSRVQVSLKTKLMLVGGLMPLLSYTLLLHHHWLHSGLISRDASLLWFGLVMLTIASTALAIRSMAGALRPVQEALRRSGATTHEELSQLQANSSDEIGYLTHMLGKVFRRLGDQESQMRAVVDTAAEGIVVVNEHGVIDTFNVAAEKLFGYAAPEIRGRPLGWLLPECVASNGVPLLLPGERETYGVRRSGKSAPMAVRSSELHISGRRMITLLVADISVRKAAEDELLKAEKRYRDLVETAHDLVWSIDTTGRWSYLNSAAQNIYGLEPEQMIGRSFSEFHAPDYEQRDAAMLEDILNGKELLQYETVHLDQQGKPHHLSFSARAHLDEDGKVTRISGTARDITEQKAFERRLAYQAEHDSLTGLFNRNYFQQELERVVARVGRGGSTCAIFYIDLDQFKYINDTLGHAAGDRLLIEISTLLSSHVRESDLLARFGGDEFTVLLYDIDAARAMQAAENFRAFFDRYKFYDSGNAFNVTCSIGAALIDSDAKSADEVMAHADLACNMAKAHGRNRANLYDPADRDKAGMAEDMGWAARVRDMLEQDRFKLVYQPILSVHDGRVCEYEALMRMVCDDGQIILPGGFMPAAERFGLIHSVDRWVVTKAITHLAELKSAGHTVSFAINLSGRAFEDAELLPLIGNLLKESGLDPQQLTFEITETAAIANLTAATKFIRALKDIGCQFALDDFGSGFCSFTYLKHLPVDKLKIDGSFVQSLATAPVDQAMVQSMNQVAHALGKVTVAEYVENAQSLELLREYGVDFAQGNFLGVPQDNIPLPIRPALTVVGGIK